MAKTSTQTHKKTPRDYQREYSIRVVNRMIKNMGIIPYRVKGKCIKIPSVLAKDPIIAKHFSVLEGKGYSFQIIVA